MSDSIEPDLFTVKLGPYRVFASIEESGNETFIYVTFARNARLAPLFSSEVSIDVANIDGSMMETEKISTSTFLPEIVRDDVAEATAAFRVLGDPAALTGGLTARCDYGSISLTLMRV